MANLAGQMIEARREPSIDTESASDPRTEHEAKYGAVILAGAPNGLGESKALAIVLDRNQSVEPGREVGTETVAGGR